jgi:hypothetical protein
VFLPKFEVHGYFMADSVEVPEVLLGWGFVLELHVASRDVTNLRRVNVSPASGRPAMKTTPIDTPRRELAEPGRLKRAWRSGAATADRAYAELWAWHGLVSRCNPLRELRLKATSAEAARDLARTMSKLEAVRCGG